MPKNVIWSNFFRNCGENLWRNSVSVTEKKYLKISEEKSEYNPGGSSGEPPRGTSIKISENFQEEFPSLG